MFSEAPCVGLLESSLFAWVTKRDRVIDAWSETSSLIVDEVRFSVFDHNIAALEISVHESP